jgi:hypothetical protein
MFDPFAKQPFSKTDCLKLFGPAKGTGALAAKTQRENPALYDAIRESAVAHGLLAPKEVYVPKPDPKVLTPEENRLRGKYSRDEIRLLFKSGDTGSKQNAATLYATDKAKYDEMYAAGVAWRELPPKAPAAPVPSRPVQDGHFLLSREICEAAGLPEGSTASAEQFGKLSEFMAKRAKPAPEEPQK